MNISENVEGIPEILWTLEEKAGQTQIQLDNQYITIEEKRHQQFKFNLIA